MPNVLWQKSDNNDSDGNGIGDQVVMVVTESGDGDYGGGKSDNHGEGGTSDGDVM